jgi:Kae1-associated kinase Bud32
MKLLSQGAEAKIYIESTKSKFIEEATVIKKRIPKKYRHPQLDRQIRQRRTRSEAKIINRAFDAKINVPKIHSINKEKNEILIQHIEGDRLSKTLNSYPEKKQFKIMQQIGKQVELLHKNNIIHGDLTTSNIIRKTNNPEKSKEKTTPYIIDFGLGFISTKIEDKAVDLHLIKQALEAKHFQNNENLFKQFLKTYKNKEVIDRLTIVEKRGRYKH